MSTNSSHHSRNRTPAGVPSGGQFAAERRGEAGLSTLAAPTDETPADDTDDGGRLDLSGTVEERWEAFAEGGRTVKARFTPEEWGDNDYAYPAGPDQEVDVTAILDRRGLGDLDDTSLDNARDALYEAAVEAGYARGHDGPYSFEIDPDDLEEYTIGRERYGLENPRTTGPVPVNPDLPRAADHGGVTASGSKAAAARFDDAMWAANMDRITQTRAREVADQITEECPEARTFVLDSDGSEDGYEYVSRVFDDDGNELDVDTAVFDAFPPDEAQQMEHLGQEVVSDYDSTTGQLTYRPLADGERLPLHERYKLTRRYSIDLGFGPREHRRSGRWSGPPPLADTCIAKREPRPTGSSPAVSTAAHSPGIETPRTSNHQEEISMKKRYAFRAYPTGDQARALARLFGCCRLVYNRYIDRAREDHAAGIKYRGATAYQHEVLTRLKKHPDYTFLTEVSGVPLVQTVRDADQAYRNYFNSLTGKRKGRKMRRPRFRSRKDNRQAARFSTAAGFRTTQHEDRAWGAVRLPRVGQLRFRSSRMLPSAPTSITVIQKASGRWYVSFVVEVPTPEPLPANGRVAGIDLGLTDLATITTSDGVREKIVTPKHLRRQERKLARAQRELARRKKGSANRAKSRKKVARIHEKTAAQRLDHHHKLASRLVHENQVLGLETLSIRAMARTRLARSIHDAGWGTLIRLIEEKARERGRRVYRDPAFSPSTRTCSICGVIGEKKPLGVRVWECAHCGSVLDRDYNAACNLMVAAGHAETLNACGGDVRLRLAGADPAVMRSHAKQEPAELGSCCAA